MSTKKIWTPPSGVGLLKYREEKKVVTTPTGERVQVTVSDSHTVAHAEHKDGRVDATVMPKTVVLRKGRDF